MLAVGEILGSKLGQHSHPKVVLAGFPSDEGVRRNHGRTGAALAPQAIRNALYDLPAGASQPLLRLLECTKDVRDIPVTGDLEADQRGIAEIIAPWLVSGVIPIIVGGGHETAYGHFLAHVNAGQEVTIVNWDAHPDVRPLNEDKGHSGSPFRQAILHESRRCRHYIVAGLLEARLVPEHLEFIREHGGKYYWRSGLSAGVVDDIYAAIEGHVMASFDMDAVDQSAAPGVSAPATGGMTEELWLHAATMAGRDPKTLSMDLVEVNPRFDADHRTVLLAARTILAFLTGLTQRPLAS
jgi:formiminoglutamase